MTLYANQKITNHTKLVMCCSIFGKTKNKLPVKDFLILMFLTLLCITSQNGQTHFKNFTAFATLCIKGLKQLFYIYGNLENISEGAHFQAKFQVRGINQNSYDDDGVFLWGVCR